MTNLEAIKRMSNDEMAIFLDCVYLTGLNGGALLYMLEETDITVDTIKNANPYGVEFLEKPAEEALLHPITKDNNIVIPEALANIIELIADLTSTK